MTDAAAPPAPGRNTQGLSLVIAALLAISFSTSTHAQNRYDPRLQFRTISTPRFDVHFHQAEEALARRLATLAEEVASSLDATLGPAAGRVQVILVDQDDLANGWATPLPYNIIEMTAATPDGQSLIGNTDDWLRLVFAHEYTHVVHMSRSRGLFGTLTKVFGRMPLLYPNVFLPAWQIEGIATFQESALTGQGRVPARDFRLIAGRAAAASRFLSLDRASGGLIAWPSGHAPYVYGAYFHEFLAGRYGEESLRRLTDATAGRPPYFGVTAFRSVFGRSLGELWREFADEMRDQALDAGPAGLVSDSDGGEPALAATRLTQHGFTVRGPRFAPDGRLYYSTVNPHGFPALMALSPGEDPRPVIRRYLGDAIGFADRRIVFDQLELVRNVGLQSDLHAHDVTTRQTWRLTREARAADPDVSPDGLTIVCTVQRPDRRELATLRLPPPGGPPGIPVPLVSQADTYFASPRWSPDGRWIAAERVRTNASMDIVLIDPQTQRVDRVVAASPGRTLAPAWLPDGERLLFASDRGGGAFRIFRVDLATGDVWQLEHTGQHAQAPDVSRDGALLAFVGYTIAGYDLFSLPLASAQWTRWSPSDGAGRPVTDETPHQTLPAARTPAGRNAVKSDGTVARGETQAADAEPVRGAVPADDRSRPYSPWPTLAPRFWTPTVESDAGEVVVGAATASLDALGRHAYAIEAGWSAARWRPDWQVAYAYDRWWPTMFASVSDDTDPWRNGTLRTTEVNAGLLLPVRRVRWAQAFLTALHGTTDVVRCETCGPTGELRTVRRGVRVGWLATTAQSYGYSISAEEGWTAMLRMELVPEALGTTGNAGSATGDVRGYLPVVPRHGVIAGRVAAATAWGDEAARRVFTASGSGPRLGGFRFGRDAIGLVRGIGEDALTGRHAVVANVDYRVPLWRLERGYGAWPFFARTLHAAVFADFGHAWETDFRADDVSRSLGAELSLDTVLGYNLPLTFTSGIAWRDSPVARGAVVFGRVGRAF